MTEEQNNTSQPPSGTPDEKTILLLTHLSGIIFSFIVPLVIYLVKTDGSDTFKASVKEALNFQITMLIASIVISAVTFGLGGLIVWIVNIVLCVMAAMAVSNGKDYKYPFALRLIK